MTRAALALALILAGCAGAPRPVTWRTLATPDDRDRLRYWRDTWLEALGRARAAGAGAAITAEGALFDPDGALPGAVPPAGAYRCRLFLIGSTGAAREFSVVPPVGCAITPDAMFRYSRPGGQRVSGRILPDTALRAVFLGALQFGDERIAPRYGSDSGRDLAGVLERVGDRRWRVAVPHPRFEAVLDVIEITPAN